MNIPSLDEAMLSPENNSGPGHIAKKRNRLSFVCQACRRSKTKCDKRKPACTRCAKQGIPCVYDIAIQTPPKFASRKSLVQMLDNELDFWKKKTNQLMRQQYNRILAARPDANLFGDLESLPERDLINNKLTVNDFWDLNVNIYRRDTNLIVSPIMKSEVTPLSENNIIVNDHFLITLIISVVATSTESVASLPAYASDPNMATYNPSVVQTILKNKDILVQHCSNPQERVRIEYFTKKILQIPTSTERAEARETIGSFLTEVKNDLSYPYLEDHCTLEGGYSAQLQYFISSFEELLPPYDVIQQYKQHFYLNIFPCLPFLSRSNFEATINSIVFKDPHNPQRVQLVLGTSGLRAKIENLCILGIVLKLSYMSLIFINEKDVEGQTIPAHILTQYPISNKIIALIQKCSVSENWVACPNEDIITCLLYLWSYLVFAPEEGDFFTSNPTDILCNLIIMLSTTIGLHRDPTDFKILNVAANQELRNHRRLLWLCVVGMSGIEIILKGRRGTSKSFMDSFIDIDDPNVFAKYMAKVKSDMPTIDPYLVQLHENTFKYAYIVSLHQRIGDYFLKYNGTFKLREIHILREKIDEFIKREFTLQPIDENLRNFSPGTPGVSPALFNHISMVTTKNSAKFLYTVLSKLIMLRVALALLFHFEKCCMDQREKVKRDRQLDIDNENDIDYLPYYFHFLKETICFAVQLADYINFFYDKESSKVISALTSYHVSKIIQLSLSTVLLSLLSTGLKVNVAINEIMRTNPNVTNEVTAYINQLSEIERTIRPALFRTYNLVSENLRFTYYPVFKMLVLFDIFMVKCKKDELLPQYFQTLETELRNERYTQVFGLSFNYRLGKGERMIDDLLQRNFIAALSIGQLKSITERLNKRDLLIIPPLHDTVSPDQGSNMSPNGHSQSERSSVDYHQSTHMADLNSGKNSSSNYSHVSHSIVPAEGFVTDDGQIPTSAQLSSDNSANNTSISNGVANPPNNGGAPQGIELASNDTLEFANLFGDVDIFNYDFFFGNE
ncbi:hypothetical protein DAKH74_057410 [Maudiozyma humilis]|uniref:Zn(2)-C6 fungal-type domain-containing protein n=1 Tax=Maudiozyma humilis TaxID=51915 RepID=A0AAV5S5I2_MAUHU|nr:hypothetical protein DAKH74_057410 [Kazachstania humilis]